MSKEDLLCLAAGKDQLRLCMGDLEWELLMEILVGSEAVGVVLVTRHYRRSFQQKLSRCDGDAVFMS